MTEETSHLYRNMVAEAQDFVLIVGHLRYEPDTRGHKGFQLVHRDTGVVCAEGVNYAGALAALHRAQSELDEIKKLGIGDYLTKIEREASLNNPFAQFLGGPGPDDIIN